MLILNLLKKMRKTCKQKSCKQNKGANLESVLFFATSCSFLEITVSGSTFSNFAAHRPFCLLERYSTC
jgi:hypothetical protein